MNPEMGFEQASSLTSTITPQNTSGGGSFSFFLLTFIQYIYIERFFLSTHCFHCIFSVRKFSHKSAVFLTALTLPPVPPTTPNHAYRSAPKGLETGYFPVLH